ncbi:hypothetical protein [Lacinutrix mariniflava]|uniref:hypothetical protein n=2 Tax=Lacinutrix TaxID=291183 RepID=UPI003B84930B
MTKYVYIEYISLFCDLNTKKNFMETLLIEAQEFEDMKMSNMSTSDRVKASRKGKSIILGLNEFYKESKDEKIMDVMKRVTEKKQKIEKRLKGRPSS